MAPVATGEVRRSTRVLAHIPIVILGLDSQGVPFEAPGETLVVNKHGAKIFTRQQLEQHMDIVVTIPTAKQSAPAQVVWAEEHFGTIAEVKFGIELETPENFWGIYLPPSDWEEPTAWEEKETSAVAEPTPSPPAELPAEAQSRAETPGRVHSPAPVATGSPPASDPLVIPARGVEVFVRGMSSVRIPFQDRTVLRLVDEREATILLHPVVDIGTTVQVIFPGENRAVKARTSGVSDRREKGKWKMWIQFLSPVRVATT